MKQIAISKEPAELYKVLKFADLAASGGAAKAAIDDGQVKVNGDLETRRRKKLVAGDTIEFMNQRFEIVLNQGGA
ncbi:MAG: RNA-binding S4 domain-containing protein [Lentisphaerae bacterium]|nr:RNA-binding S4 domain-containing protein [Lentisphaerota bacterium]